MKLTDEEVTRITYPGCSDPKSLDPELVKLSAKNFGALVKRHKIDGRSTRPPCWGALLNKRCAYGAESHRCWLAHPADWHDHGRVFTHKSKPVVVTFEPYQVGSDLDQVFLAGWLRPHGLRVAIRPAEESFYYPTSTVLIEIWRG